MKIPAEATARLQFYDQLVRDCAASRTQRFNLYQPLRNYYLFGSQDSDGAPYNKIGSTIETLSSFIYSADATRFSLKLGTEATADDIHMAVPLSKEVTEQWRVSKTHLLFGLGLRWSLVFGVMLMKTHWMKNHVRSYLVEPHQFGVLREDVLELSDQEAFTHHYTITKSQLMNSLEGNPRKAQIEARINTGGERGDTPRTFAEGLSRLMIGSPVAGVPGSLAPNNIAGQGGNTASGRGPSYDYAPRVETELIDLCDLYVWSDDSREYQLVTQAAPGVTLYDRPASEVGHVKGLPPFTVIRPQYNLYDYFWGDSFVAKLTWLQNWRTRRLLELDKLLSKQVDPPMSFIGVGGIAEEKMAALRAAGGQLSLPTPTGKVEVHAPEIPPNTFSEIDQIDRMFDDEAGLGHVLQGKGEPGVRSKGQADLMARLGSARPKERATAVEESAETLARLILRTTQDHSKQRFTAQLAGKPLTFIAEQFTKDYEVKVDGHSSSPIFTEDTKHDAVTLFEARAIDRETLLDMFDPPNVQELKEKLKVIEQKEQQAAAREAQQAAHQGGKRAA